MITHVAGWINLDERNAKGLEEMESIFSAAKKPTGLSRGSECSIRKQININFKQDHKYFTVENVGKLSVNVMLTALKNVTPDVYM